MVEIKGMARGRCLVTGGTGFVGSVLIEQLIRSGFAVRAAIRREVDAIPVGVEPIIVGDIAPTTQWRDALTEVDVIIHLAARVHVVRDGAANPLAEFRKTNVEGTLVLAKQAADSGVRRFIFLSSVKVNGEATPMNRPFTPDDLPKPEDPYGISKYEAELGLRQLAYGADMEVVVIRPPLVYGQRVKGNVLRLLNWIEHGSPLPFANVDNRRSLLNVRNLVDVIMRCLEHPAAAGQTFLVSDGEDISTGDLVRHLAVAMGKKPRLFSVPLLLSRSAFQLAGRRDLWQRLFGSLQIDDQKARELLGWSPPVGISEGLAEVGRWYIESKNN